jgi:hypothetical protein
MRLILTCDELLPITGTLKLDNSAVRGSHDVYLKVGNTRSNVVKLVVR